MKEEVQKRAFRANLELECTHIDRNTSLPRWVMVSLLGNVIFACLTLLDHI